MPSCRLRCFCLQDSTDYAGYEEVLKQGADAISRPGGGGTKRVSPLLLLNPFMCATGGQAILHAGCITKIVRLKGPLSGTVAVVNILIPSLLSSSLDTVVSWRVQLPRQ